MNRTEFFFKIIAAGFCFLVAGLFYLQVIRGPYYRARSEDNRIVVIPIAAPRGEILDRKGRIIVDNRIAFDVCVIYKDAGDFRRLVSFLSATLKKDARKLSARLEKARGQPYTPTVLVEDISRDEAILLEQRRIDYPALRISTRPLRSYPYKEETATVTGYLGKINDRELSRFKSYGFTARDRVGRGGLEKQYDDYLRGVEGGMQVETDSRGRQKRILYVQPTEPGKSLRITVDLDLQRFCYEAMEGKDGVVIVMNPATGAIYAFVSKPGFDPNLFVKSGTQGAVKGLLRNDSRKYQLVDRAISGVYPPGSVFKAVVAMAGLETDRIDTSLAFTCNGVFHFGSAVFHCWKEGGHGVQTLLQALQHSCDIYFYNAGLRIGATAIAQYADRFGFGRLTGIDLPSEGYGLVPSPQWKRTAKKEAWFEGETVNYAIGQGYLLVTPIQVIRMMNAFANGGYLVKPYFVEEIGDVTFATHSLKKIDVSLKNLATVTKGLVKVVNEEGGTGARARLDGITVAGKTGTAQTSRDKTHGWFSGFAPAENPTISVLVFIEYGGTGGEASVLAGKILRKSAEVGLL
ncbi:MAG: penicillin-binding protein 2 [Candidatus Omnitrophica bacterium]|nr:penicillin-binding protein 2 [Candidatus Omnitrophota bacterium]